MSTTLKCIALTLACASIMACQSVVRTDIATFRDASSFKTGTIRVVSENSEEPPSLEFRYFKDKLESRLSEVGYTPTQSDEAEFVAKLGYSVSRQEKDNPHSRVVIGGHIGYHSHYPRTSILLADNLGTEFEYLRELALSIDKAQSDEPVKVIQVKATSLGKCEHLTVVYDEMLDAIFSNLLRPDGSVENVRVKGDARCP